MSRRVSGACGTAGVIRPKLVSPSDPPAQMDGRRARFGVLWYSQNYLRVKFRIIMEVEASRAIRRPRRQVDSERRQHSIRTLILEER